MQDNYYKVFRIRFYFCQIRFRNLYFTLKSAVIYLELESMNYKLKKQQILVVSQQV